MWEIHFNILIGIQSTRSYKWKEDFRTILKTKIRFTIFKMNQILLSQSYHMESLIETMELTTQLTNLIIKERFATNTIINFLKRLVGMVHFSALP